ncbi:hypothetical protein Poli38472_003881 [Pythium oligandrum]|uniref:Uncharacterized protein n=1 Tax=Pythium oligandrum TaxID=41045 RepID=A0A8K1CP00_PYTOL|nr:hypothetical protein Poli38472_003881 [Pythium oligandrum]|eukprot:TMW66116.1 hypothetical protein Poli38472_003881 [Pythium oligandrum]
MDSRVAELQQVIFKKDLMILQLQRQLTAYQTQFGELDKSLLEQLEAEDQPVVDTTTVNTSNSHRDSGAAEAGQRRRTTSNAAPTSGMNPSSQDARETGSSSSASAPASSSSRTASGDASTLPAAPAARETRAQSSISPSGVISSVGKNVVLDFVEDSPMFRRQLESFEESLGGLRGLMKEILARTKEYVATGMRYGEEETALAEEIVHRKYSRALFTTSCPELGSLSSVFTEVHDTITQIQSSRVSMLLSIEALLHHSIYRFTEQELKEAGDLRKEVLRLADEYESQLGKLLGKSKQSGSGSNSSALTVSDPMNILGSGSGGTSSTNLTSGTSNGMRALERDVMQARQRFELARFDLVRYLNRLDSQKKFVLIECFNSTLYAFLGHFHACHELIKSIEPGLRQRQETLQKCKRDFEDDDKMWTAQREALEARLKMDADGEIRGSRAASLELPVEIISGETQIGRETFTGGVVKQGYLFVRNSMFPARSWKRRWFQIHSGKLYQNKSKHMDYTLVCDLMLSRVRESTNSNLPFCFEIIDSNQAKHLLQATSETDLAEWIEAARKSTESMLEKQSHRMVVHPEQQKCIEQLTAKNPSCADCGQVPSEWVSINIGCFLCIECSGIHRSLGVHVSKVRSLTLDSWEMALLTLLRDHLGNDVVNGVWQHSIPPGWRQPTSSSSREEKTKWIKAKYHFHGLAEVSTLPPPELQKRFFRGAHEGQISEMMWCLAHGVDVNSRNEQQETPLYICASRGHSAACDYLLLNGASLTIPNAKGKLPYDAAKASGHEAVKLALMQKMSLEQYQF